MSKWMTDIGTEDCEYCEGNYYQEVGYYCAACDSQLCATCVLTSLPTGDVLCPTCQAQQNQADDN